MTLSYLNANLDATIEHELLQINDFGFKVEIKYNENSWIFKHKPTQTLNNVTEVHHMFKPVFKHDEIAFESDIHAEGFTRRIDSIDSVVISLETEIKANLEF